MLSKIIQNKLLELEIQKSRISLSDLVGTIEDVKKKKSLIKNLKIKEKISIIGEIKKASPSKGIFKEVFKPVELAMEYSKSDIQALSVISESKFFMGDSQDIPKIREIVDLPILRKDFIIDEYQIYESKLLKSDAILLIARVLEDKRLKRFIDLSKDLGLETLVEVHNKEEFDRAISLGAKLVGINNRDLTSFETDIQNTIDLIKKISGEIKKEITIVSESGIKDNFDLERLRESGVDAVLIGESFMRARSIEDMTRSLRGEKID